MRVTNKITLLSRGKYTMTFVIKYRELGTEYEVIWSGTSSENAIRTFWESFDVVTRKHIADVKIYSLNLLSTKTDFFYGV